MRGHCDGCDETRPTKPFAVTHHNWARDLVDYCADLARMDWNGESKRIEPAKETPCPVCGGISQGNTCCP